MCQLSAMEGGGYYNQNSAMQAAGFELLLPIWAHVAQTVAIDQAPFMFVDYGSSQGRNSMRPMHVAIEEPTIASRLKANRDPAAVISARFARFAERIAAARRRHEPYLAVVVLKKR
jgi:hypothetical protein